MYFRKSKRAVKNGIVIICEECGMRLVHEGGCVWCPNCGWSKCG